MTKTNTSNTERVAIVGAGEFGLQALHIISTINSHRERFKVVGWIDDTFKNGELINGIKVIGSIEDIVALYDHDEFDSIFIAIGYKHLDFKKNLINSHKGKIPFVNIISPQSIVDATSLLGENIMIYPGVIIDKGCILKDGVTINLGSIISHDTEIDAACFIAPGVTISGFCSIGQSVFIGAGATIIDNISIPANSIIGAGSVVTSSLTLSATYAGIPAKRIK